MSYIKFNDNDNFIKSSYYRFFIESFDFKNINISKLKIDYKIKFLTIEFTDKRKFIIDVFKERLSNLKIIGFDNNNNRYLECIFKELFLVEKLSSIDKFWQLSINNIVFRYTDFYIVYCSEKFIEDNYDGIPSMELI